VRILDTELAPWRRICALAISSPGGDFIGTGWFVGPRTIITAGHCVFHEGMDGWATRIAVSPGRNGTEFPYDTVTATRFSSLNLWVDSADPDFDIGAIHLDEPIGDLVGWFGVAALSTSELPGFFVNISGYPSVPGFGTQQYFHANRILRVTGRRIFYDVDTAGGQSGSPVWIYRSDGADPTAVGIHAYGVGGTPADLGITANSAPRIIPEVLNQIKGWVQEDGRREVSRSQGAEKSAANQVLVQLRRLQQKVDNLSVEA
jgi:V8-like Glu-specific endopeptidase